MILNIQFILRVNTEINLKCDLPVIHILSSIFSIFTNVKVTIFLLKNFKEPQFVRAGLVEATFLFTTEFALFSITSLQVC